MITIFIFLSLVIISIEFFLFKVRSKSKKYLNKIQELNTELNILKNISYTFSSKRVSLKEDLEDFTVSFFAQEKYNTVIFIPSKLNGVDKKEAWRYLKNSSVSEQNNKPKLIMDQLNKLEEYLLAQMTEKKVFWTNSLADKNQELKEESLNNTAVVVSLVSQRLMFGNLIFLSERNDGLGNEDLNFLKASAGIFTFLLKKWHFNSQISLEEQFKAVNKVW